MLTTQTTDNKQQRLLSTLLNDASGDGIIISRSHYDMQSRRHQQG